jgi:hypothetical protein
VVSLSNGRLRDNASSSAPPRKSSSRGEKEAPGIRTFGTYDLLGLSSTSSPAGRDNTYSVSDSSPFVHPSPLEEVDVFAPPTSPPASPPRVALSNPLKRAKPSSRDSDTASIFPTSLWCNGRTGWTAAEAIAPDGMSGGRRRRPYRVSDHVSHVPS